MCDDANIDLFLFNKVGALQNDIPKAVNVIQANKFMRKRVGDVQTSVATVHSKKSVKHLLKKVLKCFGVNKVYEWWILNSQKKLKKQYDVSVCFGGFVDGCEFVLKKTKAKTKVVLFHSDADSVKLTAKRHKLFRRFDKILCVSESCAASFKQKYPNLASKVGVLCNMQNNDEIINKANDFNVNYSKTFNIVSVSRLSEEKAYLRSLKIFKRLLDEGFDFVWNVVGEGNLKSELQDYVSKNNMGNNVVFWGNKSNPYPYIKSADLFFLGSYHEAAPMVYGESMILGVPVLSTKTRSAEELVGEFGFVCDNDSESIYNCLKEILTDKELIKEKKIKLKKYSYNNDKIKNEFLKIVR